jgi:F-type H+-transporting ATPase subunit delta
MQGASRDALAQAWTDVERRLSQADVDAAQVGDELFGVVGVLDGQVGLRRTLSDPSLEANRKAELVGSLFGSRVSPATIEIVSGLVRSRWSRTRDLPDAIETLGVLAGMIAADLVGEADDVEDELFRFGRIVESRPQLREALRSQLLPDENKVALISALLDGKATPTTVRLVTELGVHPRGRTPEDAIADYGKVAARHHHRYVARVTTSVVLADDERDRLQSALAAMYGHDVHLEIEVDPDIVGGVVVQVGDEVLDGSIAGRLADARRRLE